MIQIADNFSYLGEKPLDARLKYNTITEMKEMASTSLYDGCLAYVVNEHKYYSYDSSNDVDITLGKWRELEIESKNYIINGYYNSIDHLFYEEDTYITAIIGAIDVIYVSLDTNKTYRFNGTIFVRLDEEIIQVTTIPIAGVDNLGKIVQFVGTSTLEYTNGFFYECIEDEENPGEYIWVAKNVQESDSGSDSLKKAITAQLDVGGISKNDSFPIGTSYDDMWDSLLNPIFLPEYVAPTAGLTYSVSSPMEVGTTIEAKTGTVTYNAGAINVNGVKQNDRGGVATNFAISTSGADTEFNDSSTSSGTFSVPALTRSTKGTLTITGTVNYAAGPQPKDSKGNDVDSPLPAGSVSKNVSVSFILPFYYGETATTTVSSFTGLTKSVTAKGQKQFKFTTNNEYMVIAYDSSYGNLSSIIDPNGFETISGWTKSTLTVGGFSYFVYVANSATTDTNAQFTFKY